MLVIMNDIIIKPLYESDHSPGQHYIIIINDDGDC